jgi:hypothetical protein
MARVVGYRCSFRFRQDQDNILTTKITKDTKVFD